MGIRETLVDRFDLVERGERRGVSVAGASYTETVQVLAVVTIPILGNAADEVHVGRWLFALAFAVHAPDERGAGRRLKTGSG